VGLTEEGTGSVTLTFLNGGMGSTDGKTRSTTLALFRGRVGLTEEETRSVTLTFLNGGMGSTDGETRSTDGETRSTTFALFKGRVGLTKEGIGSATWVHGSIEEETRLTTRSIELTGDGTGLTSPSTNDGSEESLR
jgi:hypothetical protein